MHKIDITPAQAHDLAAAEPSAQRQPDERLQAVFLSSLEQAHRILSREGCPTPTYCLWRFDETRRVSCYQACSLSIREGAVQDQMRPADGERG
jgi:hypothetical protein